ncbi:hypothetical protein J6590_022834 [Homalodisca vitripennis]|nr:hypothetical protein J6590_022834 [Homalodisca vitripennis]
MWGLSDDGMNEARSIRRVKADRRKGRPQATPWYSRSLLRTIDLVFERVLRVVGLKQKNNK